MSGVVIVVAFVEWWRNLSGRRRRVGRRVRGRRYYFDGYIVDVGTWQRFSVGGGDGG